MNGSGLNQPENVIVKAACPSLPGQTARQCEQLENYRFNPKYNSQNSVPHLARNLSQRNHHSAEIGMVTMTQPLNQPFFPLRIYFQLQFGM
jgi:hypothetical protein